MFLLVCVSPFHEKYVPLNLNARNYANHNGLDTDLLTSANVYFIRLEKLADKVSELGMHTDK